ncbi:MAG: pyridoxamine 5'-phosphate oxidase [Rhodospirillales bacterium]
MTYVTQPPGHEETGAQEPISLFREWLAAAEAAEPSLATAMTLATASASGMPSARMVLLKEVDEAGFTFYTNLDSCKAADLRENPAAALVFHWKSLKRQVRVEGRVEQVADGEADAYFATRPRGAQIGAWASKQSAPLQGRFELERRVARYAAKFHIGTIPRPGFWSGFRVVPQRIEFWQEQAFRLHDRIVYTRGDTGWITERLYP